MIITNAKVFGWLWWLQFSTMQRLHYYILAAVIKPVIKWQRFSAGAMIAWTNKLAKRRWCFPLCFSLLSFSHALVVGCSLALSYSVTIVCAVVSLGKSFYWIFYALVTHLYNMNFKFFVWKFSFCQWFLAVCCGKTPHSLLRKKCEIYFFKYFVHIPIASVHRAIHTNN